VGVRRVLEGDNTLPPFRTPVKSSSLSESREPPSKVGTSAGLVNFLASSAAC